MADLTTAELTSANRRGVGRPTVFVRSLQESEVVAFAEAMTGFQLPGQDWPIEVRVGTMRPVPGLAETVRLGADRTLTSYRNSNDFGLVLVDLDPFSDAQGLSNLRTLDDGTVLADLDDEVRAQRAKTIVECAWRWAAPDDVRSQPPHQLVARFAEVHELLSRLGTTSLRVWVQFALEAAQPLVLEDVAAHSSIDRAVGSALAAVGLFPDEQLFLEPQSLKKRLQDNFHLAQLKQPGGREIQEDELVELVKVVDLPPELLDSVGIPDESDARHRMLAVAEGGQTAERAEVPFALWLHLFAVRPDRASLGARIKSVYEDQFDDRVSEFDDLGVETGLDNGEREAAEQLLRADPPGDERPLAELLPSTLRRRIEKLATPRAIAEGDPLRALLFGLQSLERSSASEQRVVTLSHESVLDGDGDLSRAVFAFLYGPTLRDIALTAADGVGARIEVEDLLTTVTPLGDLKPTDADGSTDNASRWSPLRLVLRADGQMDPLYRFQWKPLDNPGLVALAALVAQPAAAVGAHLDETLDSWSLRSLDIQTWLDGSLVPVAPDPPPGTVVGEWLRERDRLHLALSDGGLDQATIAEYVSDWGDILERARDELVPQGSPLPELDAFLSIDVVRTVGNRLALLGTHPLRLRWFASHLENMKRLVVGSLEKGLLLNEQNDQLFFDWLDRVSPHRQPPFISGHDQQLAIPIRESGLHEEYALIHAGGAESRDWLSGIDDSSVDAITAVVRNYLDAYPHKRDGLGLLLLLRDGDPAVASRLLRQIRNKDYLDARVVLHVLTGRKHHDAITREVEDLLAMGSSIPDRFMPDVELVLHDWADGEAEPDLTRLGETIDVAIAPNLFGTKTSAQPSTRRRDTGLAGRFDPWVDASSHDLPLTGGANENVSTVLLPSQPDPMLEAWSTLSVRRFRNASVSPDADESTDYIALQVQFHVGAPLFENLHSVAHWVVTLDPFVGRDQIDALPGRPDVILVRGGVGKNRTYTLVVSSTTGSKHVTERLARKLDHDLQVHLPAPSQEIAERLYEVGRNSFPGVMLRALGLGRAAEEVLGLIVSRHAVESAYPSPSGADGAEWWISLDEHTDWFGGSQRSRADLLRVLAIFDDDQVAIRLHVVESKFRSAEDGAVLAAADQQLSRTIALFSEAFRGANDSADEETADDARFWMREVVDALDQTSKASLPASELPALRTWGGGSVDRLRSALLDGKVNVDEVVGIVVGIAYGAGGPAVHGVTDQGHQLLRVCAPELESALASLLDPSADAPPAAPDESGLERDAAQLTSAPHEVPPDVGSSPELESDFGGGQSAGNDPSAQVGMTAKSLSDRYQRVLDVFAAHNVRVSPPESGHTDQGPGFYVLRLVPDVGVSVDKLLNRSEDLKLALRLEANQHIRAFVDRGAVVLEVPKSDDERYEVLTSDLWTKAPWQQDQLYVPLGEDINGEVVGIDFSSANSPHVLIGGATGSGKSVLIETILRGATRQFSPEALRLHLVDPKGTELIDFEDSPHLEGAIGFSSEDAIALLETAVGEMQRRYELFRAVRVRSLVDYNAVEDVSPLPWWLLVLDEYADLTSDPDDKGRIERSLKRLAQKARAAGVHLLVATQKPSAEVISTTVRSNLPAQVALRVKASSDSRIIMDEAGAESLAGKGDAFLRTARGLTRFQCARYDGDV